MAEKEKPKNESGPQQQPPKGFRSFKRDLKFYDIKEGAQIKGTLVSCRQQEIQDQRTKRPKTIWVYRIRLDDTDHTVQIGGRALLDQQFQDAADDMSGGDMTALRNIPVIINRGRDEVTRDGNPMGTYELLMGAIPEG